MRATESADHSARTLPEEPVGAAPRLPRHIAFRALASLRGVAIVALSVLLLPYVFVPVYMFHSPTPFSGATLYNPYGDIGATWQRANFHAHSRAWAGLTSGTQSPDEVRAAYLARQYDIIGISNYHQLTRARGDSTFLPIYEHGFSIRKSHQLIIGARQIVGLDFPLWQTSQAKQYILARLRDSAALTAIVHPYLRTGYTMAQLPLLSGYDLLEVRSHWADASAWWDAVLSTGNPIWAIGNDDMHDITKPREMGVVWTEVNASSAEPAAVISALRRGHMYVVAGSLVDSLAKLESVVVRGDTITTRFDRVVDSARVLVDGGLVRATRAGVREIAYVLSPMDHYARVVARSAGSTLILNPVIRSAGQPVPFTVPPQRPLATIVTRLSALLIWLCTTALLLPTVRRKAPHLRRFAGVGRASRAAGIVGCFVATPVAISAQALVPMLPFRAGEYHEYDVKFGVIGVGSGSLSVSGPEMLRGREVLRLKYEIRGGIPFFRVHDIMESWFDTKHMLSLRFTQELNEGSKHYSRFYDFYPDESVVLERGKPRAPSVAQPLDDASFIFFVRTLPLEVGRTMSFTRYFRPNANPVTIQILRKESITVPAGTFNTVVVKPTIRTNGIFSEGGQAELWFSDDSAHTLIQMKAKLSFGSINLYLRPSRDRR
jgi:Protein of unknown function (DUF3108)